jgi:hypothetical protein
MCYCHKHRLFSKSVTSTQVWQQTIVEDKHLVRVANWPAAGSTASVTNLRNVSSASPRNLRVLWNQKVHYYFDTRTPPVHMTSYNNPIHALPTCPNLGFNFVLPSTPISFQWSLSLRFPHQNPVCTSPHACCMHYSPNSPLFHHSNATGRGLHIMMGLDVTSICTQYKHKQRILWLSGPNNLNWFRPFLHLPIPSLRHIATASPSYLVCSTFRSNHTHTHQTHLPKRQHTSAPIPAVQNN